MTLTFLDFAELRVQASAHAKLWAKLWLAQFSRLCNTEGELAEARDVPDKTETTEVFLQIVRNWPG